MTNKELIKILLEFPLDTEIFIDDAEIWQDDAVLSVKEVKIIEDKYLTILPKY